MAKTNSYLYLVIAMSLLSAFGPFVTDFYIPAFPALGDYFQTQPALVQSSLAASVIGLAIGQLFIGPLSDKYGRKRPLIISLALFFFATLACLWAPTIQYFIAARFLQGLLGAGGIVISRSVAADLYEGRMLTRFFSLLIVVMGVAPVIAPVFGGILLTFTDWRGIFWTLVIIVVALLFLMANFAESLPTEKRLQGSILSTFSAFIPLLQNREFMLFSASQSATMGIFFAYISSSPFIFQETYHVSPLCFSLLFGLNAVAIMIGGRAAILLSEQKALFLATCAMCVMAIVVALSLVFHAPFALVDIAFFLMMFCHGCILTTSSSLALRPIRKNKGSASAILGFFLFFVGSIVTPLVGIGNILIATGICLFVCGAASFIFAFMGIRLSARVETLKTMKV